MVGAWGDWVRYERFTYYRSMFETLDSLAQVLEVLWLRCYLGMYWNTIWELVFVIVSRRIGEWVQCGGKVLHG